MSGTTETVARRGTTRAGRPVTLGLRANWPQFTLLVAINAFVGGMVGLERSILPLLAKEEFGIASTTAAVSFIASFGLAKAVANLYAGSLSERFGRRRVLIAGWLFAIPVPLMLIWAPAWGWIVAANVFLGLNQGFAWSMTVNMKMDLVGPSRRGLALGLNEAAGYISVAAAAYLAGVIAQSRGLRPEPFYLGIAFVAIGLALSVLFARDTAGHVRTEAGARTSSQSLRHAFAQATWRRPRLVSMTQAGFVNNLNDGLAWGIFPLFFAANGVSVERVGLLSAAYPLAWGGLQLITGWVSDSVGRTPLIAGGMLVQALALAVVGTGDTFAVWLAAVALLGLGTAMVYPTLLASIGDLVHPTDRATTLGVYRFWRDGGAMAGALLGGAVADIFDFRLAIELVALLTGASGFTVLFVARSAKRPKELEFAS